MLWREKYGSQIQNHESALILVQIEIIECSFRKKKMDGIRDDLELGVQVDHSLNKIGDDKF